MRFFASSIKQPRNALVTLVLDRRFEMPAPTLAAHFVGFKGCCRLRSTAFEPPTQNRTRRLARCWPSTPLSRRKRLGWMPVEVRWLCRAARKASWRIW